MDLFICFTPAYLTEHTPYSLELPHAVQTIHLPWKAPCVFLCCLMSEMTSFVDWAGKLFTEGKFPDYHQDRIHLLVETLVALWLYPVWLMHLSVTKQEDIPFKMQERKLHWAAASRRVKESKLNYALHNRFCLPLDFDPFWIICISWQLGLIIDAIHYMIEGGVLMRWVEVTRPLLRATYTVMIDRKPAA